MECQSYTIDFAIAWTHTAVMLLAAYFAIFSTRQFYLKDHKKEIMKVKKTAFTWLTIGISSMALAYLLQTTAKSGGFYRTPGLADIFFVLSFATLAIGFDYFWYKTAKMHKLHIKEPIFIVGVVCGVFLWLYYLFVMAIIPNSAGQPIAVRALHFFYPVIVSLLFIFTLVIHPRLKAGVIRTPLWYISNGVFAYFIGYMMFTYYRWTGAGQYLTYMFSFLFLLSALYFLLGFYAAGKKYK